MDIRPVAYVTGLLLSAFGVVMTGPLVLDFISGNDNWLGFAQAALITFLIGAGMTLSTANADRSRLSLQQSFLLTTGVWLILPIFAALPFTLGEIQASYTDGFFEAMSGLTTTGSTVMTDLDTMPEGLLLWRGLLQWFGGIGIIVVAMVFLPELRIGGMQIFRSEGFDTMGKILPRARQIAVSIAGVYFFITFLCSLAYLMADMQPLDAFVHAMTTVATGGFANSDASFAAYGVSAQYVAVCFMILGALPFVRYVQILGGTAAPILHDTQVRAFVVLVIILVALMVVIDVLHTEQFDEGIVRTALFNTVSILTGTGYVNHDYMTWNSGAIMILFFAGLIGGCAGSTACSVKIFRYQILWASVLASMRRVHSPRGIFPIRYSGRPVAPEVLRSVMAFFMVFFLSIGFVAVLLGFAGLDFITSVSGAATAIANVGPGLGPEIGPTGNFSGLNDLAKWVLAFAMLIGRLELLAVFVLFTRRFWNL